MTDLKPCPFCGGEALTMSDKKWWVSCPKCSCEIGFEGMDENGFCGRYDTEAEAAAAWNARAVETCIDQDGVRDLIERYSDEMGGNARCFHNGAYARIADELCGRKAETCESARHEFGYGCSVCGASWAGVDDPNYCPNCGRKVEHA